MSRAPHPDDPALFAAARLPTLRALTRPLAEIEACARRLAPVVASLLGERYRVEVRPCASEVGSGAAPRPSAESATGAKRRPPASR